MIKSCFSRYLNGSLPTRSLPLLGSALEWQRFSRVKLHQCRVSQTFSRSFAAERLQMRLSLIVTKRNCLNLDFEKSQFIRSFADHDIIGIRFALARVKELSRNKS